NGARTTQNSYQINGVDANNIRNNNSLRLAVPAPETIQEFKVQTSLYDATFGRSGGGNVQAVTKSGANDFHGAAYEYFRNDEFNANVDYRINERNWLAVKSFSSNAPLTLALFSGPNVPGFTADQQTDNRLVSIQDTYTFSSTVTNEARIGYHFIRQTSFPHEPV